MTPLLSIQNLSIQFGNQTVVDDVSLRVARGEVLAIVGESGSGKSLSAQAIVKLLPANATISGNITFARDQSRVPNPESPNLLTLSEAEIATYRGREVGMIFQEPMTALNPLHTIDRQIIEGYCWHQNISRKSPEAKAKLAELLTAVGLAHLSARGNVYPHQLSGGERQRVMIAIAIANNPALLIADEPTTALDVTLQVQILALLKSLQQSRGMGMIFITHDLRLVRQIADRVAVMHTGKIVETAAVDTLFANPEHAYTRMLLAAEPHGSAAPIAADAPTLLSCDHLNVTFTVKSPILRRTLRRVEAVKNAELTLRTGETLGIVGESGSGKSSLGFALLRLIQSDGPIVFLGERLDQKTKRALRAARRDLQIVFQDPFSSLNPRMTVGDIIAEGLKLHGRRVDLAFSIQHSEKEESRVQSPESSKKESRDGATGAVVPHPATLSLNSGLWTLDSSSPPTTHYSPITTSLAVDDILLQVGLTPEMKHRYPHEFSGGQRQRIAIARTMILKPKLVVLDEPTSALDRSVQQQVLSLLASLQASHKVAYLFISHDLHTVRSIAHRLMVLRRGEIVESGPCADIFASPKHAYTQSLIAAAYAHTLGTVS